MVTVFLILVIAIFLLSTLGTVAYAAGLVDDTMRNGNEYSRYPLDNYQLNFYVDNGWDWLNGIGKQGVDDQNQADIPMQRKACREFAERMGWIIIREEQETGVSGLKG